MISLEDCVALSGLTEEQVLAIAEHEHLPEMAATALAQYLSKQAHGMEKIRDMIVHDIRHAQQRQDKPHILTLLHVLHHFLKSHPELCPPLLANHFRGIVQMYRDLIALRRKLAGKTRGLTGQSLSPRSVHVGGDDRVRTHCVSLLVPSEEAADCNHQHDAGEANRKLHRNIVADGGQQDLAEHREQDPEAEHL